MRVSFLGLGLMGAPMAANLARHHPTTVWNRTAEKARAHAEQHGTTLAATAEAAADTDVLFTCLPTSREVHALAQSIEHALKPGTLWVDCTSGDPAGARETAALLAAHDVAFLDAPVSGGVTGAKNGTLTTMIGGDAATVERARPALESVAAKIVHVGPTGAGMAVKAANQALLAANILALGEVLIALERNGVRAATALDVINASSGRSNVSQNLYPERVVGRAFPATFALGLMTKDVTIAAGMLRDAGVPAPLTALVENLLDIALRELGPDVDHVAAVKLLERWAGWELGRD